VYLLTTFSRVVMHGSPMCAVLELRGTGNPPLR